MVLQEVFGRVGRFLVLRVPDRVPCFCGWLTALAAVRDRKAQGHVGVIAKANMIGLAVRMQNKTSTDDRPEHINLERLTTRI